MKRNFAIVLKINEIKVIDSLHYYILTWFLSNKKIYHELPALIEKKKCSTVRELASDFPVFENYRLSLVTVFNEVLFLANEGKVCLRQMEGDVGVSVLM